MCQNTYVYYNPLTEVVIVRDGLKVGYASELGVGGVPVLFLAAELGQRPAKHKIQLIMANCSGVAYMNGDDVLH